MSPQAIASPEELEHFARERKPFNSRFANRMAPLRIVAIGAAVMILIGVALGCQAPQRVRSAAEQNRLALEALAKGPSHRLGWRPRLPLRL